MARTSSPVNTANFLQAALEGLQLQRQRIDEQIAQVRGMLGQGKASGPKAAAKSAAPAAAAPVVKERRKLSAAARKRIAIAQKKRWAAYRKEVAAGKSE